ncbi:PepSY-associated TM helix domain-containing protein [Olivibacter ginsenosidimutans]
MNSKPKKQSSRSLFYRISAWLHLWLGLITGIIMVIVCVTGCIWVFQDELTTYIIEPETRVAYQEKPVLSPSQLQAKVDEQFPGKKISYASYQQGKAIFVGLGQGRRGGTSLRIHPYTGEVISVKERKEGETDFFRFILNGHRFLWLPYEIGRPIVNYSTLIFVITLITGMVLWWPKKWNKSTRERSFFIKWKGTFKRVNYDLHNVLGFYSLFIVFAIACTGIVYGIEWFSKGLYWTTTGGDSLPSFVRNESDSLQLGKFYTPQKAMDIAWNKVIAQHPDAKGFYYNFPDTSRPKSTLNITIYPSAGKFYDNVSYAFDQHTLKEMPKHKVYGARFEDASFGVKLRKMNYDIHVGSILGLPGKVIAFFASLIGASLPITGFIIWWGKRKKKPKKKVIPKKEHQLSGTELRDLMNKERNLKRPVPQSYKPVLNIGKTKL